MYRRTLDRAFRFRGLVGWAMLAYGVGCAGSKDMAAGPRSPSVALRSPDALPHDFRWRQQVTVRYKGGAPRTFAAVLEKRSEVLTLVGLTPINTVLFVAEVRGTRVRFENRTGQPLPFDGSHILRDVQRAFFPWLDVPFVQGRRQGEVEGVRIMEARVEERLVERVFESSGEPRVCIRYEWKGHERRSDPPLKVILIDEGRDYRLDIESQAEK